MSLSMLIACKKNRSCQRHFTKIMANVTATKNKVSYSLIVKTDAFEHVVETTFAWLIDEKTPVAVQANCLDILYNLSEQYGWIKDELASQTEFLLRNGSAAMQSRGKRILRKLNKTLVV